MKIDEIKGRVWAFVLYPESCIDYVDMINYLDRLGVPMAISPLHQPELNDDDVDDEKKHHYHILMYFDGQKTKKQLLQLLDYQSTSYDRQYFNWDILVDKNNVLGKKAKYPFFLKVNSLSSYYRYLIHLDSPKKQQFPCYKISHFVADDEQKFNHIVQLNGFNEKNYLQQTKASAEKLLLDIVRENQFKKITELMTYLVYSNNHYLVNWIESHYVFCRDFLLADLIFESRIKGVKNVQN